MTFNPSKCEVLHITRKRNPVQSAYTIHGHSHPCSSQYRKVLWHYPFTRSLLESPCRGCNKKASNSFAFLRRNLYNCPSQIKAMTYTLRVRPTLEYASTVWDPHTQACIQQLELRQNSAELLDLSRGITTQQVAPLR